MGMNHTPIDNSMTIEKAISQGGYYNTYGDWNCVLTFDEYPDKIFRGRVEVLVINDGKVFMLKKDDGTYRIPGGGFDRGVLNKDQAFIETKEEAKLIITNIRETGVNYFSFNKHKIQRTEYDIDYDGSYNEVYIADYKEDYHGDIRKGLSDNELTNNGKFYDLEEVKDILTEPHKQAIYNTLNKVMTESITVDELSSAYQFQNNIVDYHKQNLFNCIDTINIGLDENGLYFAQFNTSKPSEINDVKTFIEYCNSAIDDYHIIEPQNYDNGLLYITNNESKYFYPYLDSDEFIQEATKQMNQGKYPLFIINTYTGTEFGKLIVAYTRAKYNHSSISFDTTLKKLYSFNLQGFVDESLDLFTRRYNDAKMQVRCLFVDKEDLDKIKERVDYIWDHRYQSKYDINNIINIIFNMPKKTNGDKMSMVCSQFVSWILSISDIKLLDKPFNLITPKDLSTIDSPNLYLIYEGLCREYDNSKINRMFRKLKEKSKLYKSN